MSALLFPHSLSTVCLPLPLIYNLTVLIFLLFHFFCPPLFSSLYPLVFFFPFSLPVPFLLVLIVLWIHPWHTSPLSLSVGVQSSGGGLPASAAGGPGGERADGDSGGREVTWQVEYPLTRSLTNEVQTLIRLAPQDLGGIVPLAMVRGGTGSLCMYDCGAQ